MLYSFSYHPVTVETVVFSSRLQECADGHSDCFDHGRVSLLQHFSMRCFLCGWDPEVGELEADNLSL